MRKVTVSATQASSVTLKIWQHGTKENYSKFEIFKMAVNTKTSSEDMRWRKKCFE